MELKQNTMKFKVINDENKRVVAMNLTIDVAREIAKAYNTKHKTDIFTINSQLDQPYKNGEEIDDLVNRIRKAFENCEVKVTDMGTPGPV